MAQRYSLAPGMAMIFDLDGVIVDSNPVHEEVWRSYLRRFGIEVNGAMLSRMYGRRNDEIVRDFFGSHLSPEEVFEHGAAKEAHYRRAMKGQIARRLVPGVKEFIEKHKASPIGLATNAEPANAEFVLAESGLRSYFRVIVDAHQVDQPKPDPRIYRLAAQRLGVPPRNCIVFEDSSFGVRAARAAGARVVGVTTTHASLAEADLIVKDFLNGELEPWLVRQSPSD